MAGRGEVSLEPAGDGTLIAHLSGDWTLGADGALQLGEDAEPARAELAGAYLRIQGTDGALVFERAVVE